MTPPGSPLVVRLGTLLLLFAGCSGERSGSGRGTANPAGPPSAAAGTSADIAGGATAGASAGSGGAAPISNAGAALPAATSKSKPPLDPNVDFSWPESSPGGGAQCQEGTYTGTFDCVFTDPSGLIPDVELMGPVSLTFMKSMNGEFLEITDGEFEALGNDLIGGKAKITGKLDCSTLMLAAMAVDGEWTIGDPNAPLLPGGGLEGDIMGTLDPATGTLSGQWSFNDPELGACPGTWSVMYTP